MNLFCSSLMDAWRTTIWPTCRHLVQEYLAKPIRGMIQIGSGLLLVLPDLVDAAKLALVSQMPADARRRVRQGFDRIARGWAEVRVPLVVLVLVVAFGWDGLLLAISVASLMPA